MILSEMGYPRKTDQELEALKTLVVMFGPREAARQCNLNEDTVCGLAWRRKWRKAGTQEAGAESTSPVELVQVPARLETAATSVRSDLETRSASQASSQVPSMPAATTVSPSPKLKAPQKHSPSAAVNQALSSFRSRSQLGLAKYSARAAELAAEHKSPLEISRKVKDVSDVHKALWPAENQGQNILQIGVLIGNDSLGQSDQD